MKQSKPTAYTSVYCDKNIWRSREGSTIQDTEQCLKVCLVKVQSDLNLKFWIQYFPYFEQDFAQGDILRLLPTGWFCERFWDLEVFWYIINTMENIKASNM